jgi:hypothetical protein
MSEKTKFVLGTGVLAWGVPMFLVMSARELFFDRPHATQTTSHFIFQLLIGLAIWLTAGAGFGLAVWEVRQRKQRKKQSAG